VVADITGERRPFPVIDGDELAWLSAEEMREVDRIMVDELGIVLIQMMENAGRNLAELALTRFAPATATVLVGSGGNGGGGMVAARHLTDRGVDVRVVRATADAALGELPRLQLETLRRMHVPVTEEPAAADLVVDALIGYALSGDPRGRQAELITWTAGQTAPVLSLDVPSGLDATSGRIGDPCVRATATLTLAMPKIGLRPGRAAVGELYLADISVPPSVYLRVGHKVDPLFARGTVLRVGESDDRPDVP
jgi:NAD(P)H-hydrate epimerase